MQQGNFKVAEFEPLMDVTFFKEVERLKFEVWKLDDAPREVYGFYQASKFDSSNLKLNFSNNSFACPKNSSQSGPYEVFLKGKLRFYNTVEAFETADLQQIYADERKELRNLMNNLKAMNCHFEFEDVERKLATSFYILIFGDLRRHIFRTKFVTLSPR
jgi:ubiquitin-like modifier-activating enzyme ATG7